MIGSNMQTILITGINGFLGSYLAKSLSNEYSIIGLEYSLNKLFRLKGYNFKVYFSTIDELENIFTENKIDFVIHTATVYRNLNESIESLFNTNIKLPIKLFELANKFNSQAFINTDTFFNNPQFEYSYLGEYTLSKKHCLEWLKIITTDIKLINMKLFHMYGPNDSPNKFVPQIIHNLKNNVKDIKLTKGEQKRDFIYITDVISAFYCVINNFNSIKTHFSNFDVGTGSSTTIRKFVEISRDTIKSNSTLNFGALEYRKGEIMDSIANTKCLEKLGWKPHIDIYNGLNELIKYSK